MSLETLILEGYFEKIYRIKDSMNENAVNKDIWMLTDNSFIGIFHRLNSKELISIINLLVDSLDTDILNV